MRFHHNIIWGIIFTVVLVGITAFSFYLFLAANGQNSVLSIFIPGLIWVVISFIFVHFLGRAEDRSIRKAALNSVPGLTGFAVALIGGAYSAINNQLIVFIITVLFSYAFSYFSWKLFQKQIPAPFTSFQFYDFWKRWSYALLLDPPLFKLFHYWKRVVAGRRVMNPDAAAQMLTFRDVVFYTVLIDTILFLILGISFL